VGAALRRHRRQGRRRGALAGGARRPDGRRRAAARARGGRVASRTSTTVPASTSRSSACGAREGAQRRRRRGRAGGARRRTARGGCARAAPDVAIAIDVTYATDVPADDAATGGTHARRRRRDLPRAGRHPARVELLWSGREEGIAHGRGRAKTYTTPTSLSPPARDPDGLVSIPLRNMHSPIEIVQLSDLEACIRLRGRGSPDSYALAFRACPRSDRLLGVRTPFGSSAAASPATRPELGALVIRPARPRRLETTRSSTDHGPRCSGRRRPGAGTARPPSAPGLPKETPADTINKVCALVDPRRQIADAMIRAGEHDGDRDRRDGVDVERALPAEERLASATGWATAS
jgi:hypothetical protein